MSPKAQATDLRQEEPVSLNYIFFDKSNPRKTPRCWEISSLCFKGQAQYCRSLISILLLKEFQCSADETSISFWKPRTKLWLETTTSEDWAQTFKEAKDFCTPILLPRSFLNTLIEEVKNVELVHLIIEVESTMEQHPYKKRDEVTDLGLSQEFVPSPTSLSVPKRPHQKSNPPNEAPDRPIKRPRLEPLPGSDTVYMSIPEPGSNNIILPHNSNFKNLVTAPNIIFADKTAYIEKLDKNPQYRYLFLRPRRWGKSIFLETLACYYNKAKKDSFNETFGRMYIGKHPTPDRSSLLVLLFDFSSISPIEGETKNSFDLVMVSSLRRFLWENAKFLGSPDINKLTGGSGSECLLRVLELVEQNNQKLFVGVDEYDGPVNTCLFSNKPDSRERFEAVGTYLQTNFFSIMKQTAARGVVHKYWLTGVLPVFRNGISALSAVLPISSLPDYHGLCGLTDDEVRTIAKAYLGDSLQLEAQMAEIKRWFNGYSFCKDTGVTLYNPHQVFTHLQFFHSSNHHHTIGDEISAIHSSSVLDSIRHANPNPDFFVDALYNQLTDNTIPDITAADLELGKNDDLALTLLYYFGVLTFHSAGKLGTPNATMRRFVTIRLRQYWGDQNQLDGDAQNARINLAVGDTSLFVKLLQSFLQDRPVRSSDVSEAAFQIIIEAIFMKTEACFPELCLVVDPTKCRGDGRFGFIDLFFLATNTPCAPRLPVLELKAITLTSLWYGARVGAPINEPSATDLQHLRETLKNETKENMMKRQYRYWDKKRQSWQMGCVQDLKNQAMQQVAHYLDVLSLGRAARYADAGFIDRRIGCGEGKATLVAYVVLCIGGTRVLAWETGKKDTKFDYVPLQTNLL